MQIISSSLFCGDSPAESRLVITKVGAIGDSATLNTVWIQDAIDRVATQGGGTVVVPEGIFLTGALFLKPKVNLHLDRGGVLRCSTDMVNFPPQRTRIEGHFEDSFNPALLNANLCNGLRITGEGTLDGDGQVIWDLFWKLRSAAQNRENFRNLAVPRARLCLIENSNEVTIQGITFKNSQFWNLHLYRSRGVLIEGARFQVPDDYEQAPSTDGIDVDSCQDVAIRKCWFSVTDDCIALKGSKGPDALEDRSSPPVERVRVEECVFQRGHAAVTFGSEATVVRDVAVEKCQVLGEMSILLMKLRPDTPQRYENVRFSGITVGNDDGSILKISPWRQYFDLKGKPAPLSIVRDIVLSNVNGCYGELASIEGNPGQTEISDIVLENFDVSLQNERIAVKDVDNLQIRDVKINGKPFVLREDN